MPHAIRMHAFGGPEVMQLDVVEVGEPGRRQVRIRQTAIGLNFIDVYERTGLYRNDLPSGLGREAAGIIEAIGPGVTGFEVGDRVTYVLNQSGAYADVRIVPADRLVKIPPEISDCLAAAMMLKGLTAHFLLRRTYRVKRRDTIVVHAAAGGVGLILTQWAKHLGARVIAVVGSEQKAAVVSDHGADEVVLSSENLAGRVRSLTRGKGVPVVYDSVGKDTFFASLDCLQLRGLMVSFGNASGPVPPIAPLELSKRGSLFLTRPTLFHYIARRSELARAARELFEVLGRGAVQVRIGQTYRLDEVAQAHRDLESRKTTGSTVLLP